MKVEYNEETSVRKSLSFEIEPEVVEREIEERARHYARRAKLPGFRPGKIPPDVIKRRFRQQVHVDGMARHQLGDERFLPDPGQVIGGRVFHREEMPAEALPERALAVGVEFAAQFGDYFQRKPVRRRDCVLLSQNSAADDSNLK